MLSTQSIISTQENDDNSQVVESRSRLLISISSLFQKGDSDARH